MVAKQQQKMKEGIRERILRIIIDNTLAIADDYLDNREKAIVSGILTGKALSELAAEFNLTDERTRQILRQATDKLLPYLNHSELREENEDLRVKMEEIADKIESLSCEVESLREEVRRLSTSHKWISSARGRSR